MKKAVMVSAFLLCFFLAGCAALPGNADPTQLIDNNQNQAPVESDGSDTSSPELINMENKDNDAVDIPVGFLNDEPYESFRQEVVANTFKNDDREIVINSGCGWSLAMNQELLKSKTDWSELIEAHLGFDIEQFLNKKIYVLTYDTVPAGSIVFPGNGASPVYTSDAPWITYLFVFCDDDLIYCSQLESKEQFVAVVDLCNKLREQNRI